MVRIEARDDVSDEDYVSAIEVSEDDAPEILAQWRQTYGSAKVVTPDEAPEFDTGKEGL